MTACRMIPIFGGGTSRRTGVAQRCACRWRRSPQRLGYIVGSLNGGEVSPKLNREMALKVASDEAYSYLADVFWHDWDVTP